MDGIRLQRATYTMRGRNLVENRQNNQNQPSLSLISFLQFYPDYQKDIAVSLWMCTVYMRILFPDAKNMILSIETFWKVIVL